MTDQDNAELRRTLDKARWEAQRAAERGVPYNWCDRCKKVSARTAIPSARGAADTSKRQ